MNPISLILSALIYRPIFNLIAILLVIFSGNLGIAIIFLTIIVRFLLLQPTKQGNNMQKDMIDIQPRLKEIQEKYKDNPQKLTEETMKLFKTQGNPLKGCLMMLIQIPIFIGLFYVIKDFSLETIDKHSIYSFLYNFVHTGIDNINHIFLGIDLFAKASQANLILAIIAGILMYIQIKLTMLNKPQNQQTNNIPGMPQMPDMNKMMGFMNIFMVFMMTSFVFGMPAGIGLYIVTSTLFTIIQYSIQYKELIKIKLSLLFSKK